MCDENAIGRIIRQQINRLRTCFRATPHILLTEEDMRMHLCVLLLPHFQEHVRTEDGKHSISIHSEVRWYGDGKLRYRSDIVIMDVSTLVVGTDKLKLPSKGYGFNVPKAIIELKFRRPNGPSDSAFRVSIQADLDRLTTIREQLAGFADNTCFHVVFFDKKNCIQPPSGHSEITLDYEFSAEENREQSHAPVGLRLQGMPDV